MTPALQTILDQLTDVSGRDGKWQARCPAHKDIRASLSIGTGEDGRVLVHCHAGCATNDIVAAVGLEMSDLMPPRCKTNSHYHNGATKNSSKKTGATKKAVDAAYDYCGTDGELIFQTIRYKPKQFSQRRPDGKDGWIWNKQGCPVVPYHLPQLVQSGRATVYAVEGEKDVQSLESIGLVATCNAGGAGKWKAEHSEWLRDRDVVVLPDNDAAGRSHADKVARSLQSVAESVKVVALPGLQDKGDVTDWINQQGRNIKPDEIVSKLAEIVANVHTCGPSGDPNEDILAPDKYGRPGVILPGEFREIKECAAQLGELIGVSDEIFTRGDVQVSIEQRDKELVLKPFDDKRWRSRFEEYARLFRRKRTSFGIELRRATCSVSDAGAIAAADEFYERLPRLVVLSSCPMLVEGIDGTLKTITGYDRHTGCYASGELPPEVELPEAVTVIEALLDDFKFASEGDRSRAIAAFLTPAMVLGGLLRGRAPIDLGEADKSQTGKGYRNKLTAAIYGQKVSAISPAGQNSRGVGGLEEAFDAKLISGSSFIAFDNMRGKIDSPKIESFLTEDSYTARCAYSRNTDVDPRRIVIMLTSNKAELTTDLANRSSCVRILKQSASYQFRRFGDKGLLEHVKENQSLYVGAVFAIVKYWHAKGRPRTAEHRHDFREWSQPLDWIVQHVFKAAPLMDGHREAQQRMASPQLSWLREVALVVKGSKESWVEWFQTHEIFSLLVNDGTIEIPGLKDGDPEDEALRQKVLLAIGKRLSSCFAGIEADDDGHVSVDLDGMRVTREEFKDDVFRKRNRYRFSATPACAPHAPRIDPRIETADPRIPRRESPVSESFEHGDTPCVSKYRNNVGPMRVCGGGDPSEPIKTDVKVTPHRDSDQSGQCGGSGEHPGGRAIL